MIARSKTLREQRRKLIADIRAVYAKEDDANYKWLAEDTATVERMEGELTTCEDYLARAERSEELGSRLTSLAGDDEKRDRRIGREDFKPDNTRDDDGEENEPTFRDRAAALQAWFRCGSGQQLGKDQRAACNRLGFDPSQKRIDVAIGDEGFITELANSKRDESPDTATRSIKRMCQQRLDRSHEARAMSAFQGATGGYMVPMEFLNLFDQNMLDFSGVMQVAEIIRTTSGGEMPWITSDDTANEGEFIGESASMDGSTEPSLGQQMWYAYKCHAKMLKVPHELIEDNAFNLVGRIGAMLGERLARIKERKATLGSGVKEPRGFTLDTTLGVTSAGATAITFDELIDLQASIDPAYAGNCRWMMHYLIAAYLRKRKDSNNNYIWQPGTRAGEPDTILGRGITYNAFLQSTVATATKTVYYGDFSKIKFREVGTLRLVRLDERYAELDQVAFDAIQRVDSKLLKTATPSVKHLLQA